MSTCSNKNKLCNDDGKPSYLRVIGDKRLPKPIDAGNGEFHTPGAASALLTRGFSEISTLKDGSEKLQEYSLCLLNNAGVMTKEGVFKVDVALSKVPEAGRAEAEKTIDECLTWQHLPPAGKAWYFLQCYNRKVTNSTFF